MVQGISAKLSLNTEEFDKGIVNAMAKVGDFSTETTHAIGEISTGFEKADESAKKVSDTTEASSQKQGQSWSRVGKAIGAVALVSGGLFKSMVDASPSLSVAFAEMSFEFNEMFMILGESLAPIIEDVLVPAIISLTDFIIGLDTEVQTWIASGIGLTAGISVASSVLGIFGVSITALLGPVGLVILAIGSLALAYHTNFGGMKDTLDDVFSHVKDSLQSFGDSHSEQFSRIGDLLKELWEFIEPIIDIIAKLWIDNFAANIKFAFDLVMIAVDFFLDYIEGFMNIIKGIFTGDWELVMEGFTQIVDSTFTAVGDVLDVAMEKFLNVFDNIGVAISDLLENFFGEEVSDKFDDFWNGIGTSIEKAFDSIKGYFDDFKDSVMGVIDAIFGGDMGEKASIFMESIKQAINVPLVWLNDNLLVWLDEKIGEIGSFFGNDDWGFSWRIPTFHEGGTVPGPIGQPVPIMALGGEEITNPMLGQTPSSYDNSRSVSVNNKIIIQNPQLSDKRSQAQLVRTIDTALSKNLSKYILGRG